MPRSNVIRQIGSYLFLILLFNQGCTNSPEFLAKDDLVKYVLTEQSGLTKTIQSGDYSLRATYRPTDLIVSQHAATDLSQERISSLREKYSPYYYFQISLNHKGDDVFNSVSPEDYSILLETVSFRMSEYVHAVVPADTVDAADYIYNRTFGLSKSTDLLFVFENSKLKKSETIRLHISEFGLNIGEQIFEFKIEDLEKSPKISW